MTIIPIFVDTNAFIQMRDLKDIPWGNTFPQASRVDIIVTAPVIKELETFKVGTNERRRDRSRAALALIDEAMELDTMALELRSGRPSVWLKVAAHTRIDEARFPQLDLAKSDDQIVAHAAVHGEDAIVFSHDRGPRISARAMSVKTLKPVEAWLLPPERSDKDRKIEQLERAARERHPKIVVTIGEGRESFEGIVPILPPLDPEAIIRKMDAILAAYPRASLRRSSNIEEMMGYGLSSDTIDRYLKKYEEFKQGAAKYFERLHTLVRRAALVVDVPYKITNESGVAAKGLRIEARLEGDAWIAGDRADAYRQIGIPSLPGPPKPPSPHDGLRISPHLFNNFGSPPEPRDPTGFYWADRPEVGDKAASIMCEDYHPRRSWDDSALIVTNEVTFVGALRFHVIASNLPEPINASLAVRLIEREATWDDPAIVEMLRGIVTIEDD